jgi:hypothetical protein
MMKIFLKLLALSLFMAAQTAMAANYYVRAGATGTNNGLDWANAYPTLPNNLARGNTYYIADGSYAGYLFDDPAVGSSIITIKKATVADHGTSVGWNDTYGDGQATFSGGFVFSADYYVIDGAKRNDSDWSDGNAYGFRIPSFTANTAWASGVCASNLTMQYINGGGTPTGDPPTGGVDQVFYVGGFAEYCQNWTMTRNYIHDSKTTYHMNGISGTNEISYSYIVNGWSKEAVRGQIHASGFTIKHNIWKDSCQGDYTSPDGAACTGIIAMFDGYQNSAGWANTKIYGNVFWTTNSSSMQDGIVVVGGSSDSVTGVVFHNNTLAGFEQGNIAVLIRGSGAACSNNLSYDNVSSVAYSGCSGSSNINVTSNPFVNYSSGNFRLNAATAAGYSLSSPYNIDLLGNVRGADGNWDLGAFEYASGTVVYLSTPTNLRFIQ